VKHIPLRTVQPSDAAAAPLVYADAIRMVIRQPLDPSKGVSIEEMRKGIRILDKLDAAGNTLDLEDADYEHLKAKLEGMAWGMVDRDLLDFIDTVLNAAEGASANGLIEKREVPVTP
jgi:hypothetical protein